MKSVLIAITLLTSLNLMGQNDNIKNNKIRNFVAQFEEVQLPLTISDANPGEIELDTAVLFYLLDIVVESDIFYETYTIGKVFYMDDYFGLTLIYNYTPGAFGIDNYSVILITMDYFGNVIDQTELTCFCHDSDMGDNMVYYTESIIQISSDQIIIDEDHISQTLFEDEVSDGNYIDEHELKKIRYRLNKNGTLSELDR